jgi:hypothetical protein
MSDENFFTRWSRRKAEAAKADATKRAAENPAPPEPNDAAADASPEATTVVHSPEKPAAMADVAPFDVKDLPSIDSIGPDTDVSVFLRPGVPAELARAALRRAWTSDPAIRDFIGLSENSWDFTAPHGVPGFGPLSPEDAARLMAAFTARMPEAAARGHPTDKQDSLPGEETQHQARSGESADNPSCNQIPPMHTAIESQPPAAQPPLHASQGASSGDNGTAAQHIQPDPMHHAARRGPVARRRGGALPH